LRGGRIVEAMGAQAVRVVLSAAVGIAVLAGCGAPTETTIGVGPRAMTVRLADEAMVVERFQYPAPRISREGLTTNGAINDRADARVLYVWWGGGPCPELVTITTRRAGTDLAIEIDNGPRRCTENRLATRVIQLFLDEPIPAQRVQVLDVTAQP
jgi:hypothetical protein